MAVAVSEEAVVSVAKRGGSRMGTPRQNKWFTYIEPGGSFFGDEMTEEKSG